MAGTKPINKFKKFFKGLKRGMKDFGLEISTLINFILLLIVYIIGAGITSLFAKLFHKKFLDTKIQKKKKSYWSELNLGKETTEEHYRQF